MTQADGHVGAASSLSMFAGGSRLDAPVGDVIGSPANEEPQVRRRR